MAAYVPPHARKDASKSNEIQNQDPSSYGKEASRDASTSSTSFRIAKENLTPASTLKRKPLFHRDEIHEHYWPTDEVIQKNLQHSPSTLNGSASSPGSLQYVILYNQAHPRWECERIIFVKSDLQLLGLGNSTFIEPAKNTIDPGSDEPRSTPTSQVTDAQSTAVIDVITSTPAPTHRERLPSPLADCTTPNDEVEGKNTQNAEIDETIKISEKYKAISAEQPQHTSLSEDRPIQPIAVFEQVRKSGRSIQFVDYFRIKRLEYLPPWSEGLTRMMEQKWGSNAASESFHDDSKKKARERDASRWNQSFNVPWAVVQFEKLPNEERPCDPGIRFVNLDEHERQMKQSQEPKMSETKSVNELLKQMRLQEKAGSPEPSA